MALITIQKHIPYILFLKIPLEIFIIFISNSPLFVLKEIGSNIYILDIFNNKKIILLKFLNLPSKLLSEITA